MEKKMFSNVVKQKSLREVQLETLKKIQEVVTRTAGPYGTSTMIMHDNRFTEYTKDGHKVLSNIKFFRPLEQAVHDELIGITEHVVSTVGDGTTTAVDLSYRIFDNMVKSISTIQEGRGIPTHMIIEIFQELVDEICKRIAANGRDLTADDIYDICMISTNGNKMASEDIANIYKTYGIDTHIQLGISNTESSILKVYDGVVFNRGFNTPAFVNDAERNAVTMRNPRIYYFEDPVDTPEMCAMLMSIFQKNIYEPYQRGDGSYVPTVILAPSISRDIQGDLEDIEKIFYAYDQAKQTSSKPPFCIITGVNQSVDNISDIILLCGCPSIRKFINPDAQAKAIEEGTAPTRETITEFYGTADAIEIDMSKTKIINPSEMFDKDAEPNEDGSRPTSSTYNAMIAFYEKQIEILSASKEDINTLGNMKRKLHFLKANLVEYLVGGIAVADRDNDRDLVEDAILNCRSAAANGVGYGMGFEGYRVINDLLAEIDNYNGTLETVSDADFVRLNIIELIAMSYHDMITDLISTAYIRSDAEAILKEMLEKGKPVNLRTKSFDGNQVLCSIKTDEVILQAIAKIITLMYVTDQALLVEPTHNLYIELD